MTTADSPFSVVGLTVANRGAAVIAMNSLFSRSAWFMLMPLPDGHYHLTVKANEGHEQNLRSKVASFAILNEAKGSLPGCTLEPTNFYPLTGIVPADAMPLHTDDTIEGKWRYEITSQYLNNQTDGGWRTLVERVAPHAEPPPKGRELTSRLFVLSFGETDYLVDALTGDWLVRSRGFSDARGLVNLELRSTGQNRNWPGPKTSSIEEAIHFVLNTPDGRSMLLDKGFKWPATSVPVLHSQVTEFISMDATLGDDSLAAAIATKILLFLGPETDIKPCEGCGFTGVRFPADPGAAFTQGQVPAGWAVAERCDTCGRYESDIAAAREAINPEAKTVRSDDGREYVIAPLPPKG